VRLQTTLATAALAVVASAAHALPCQSMGSFFGSCHYDVTLPVPISIPGSVPVTFPAFDPALGTLTLTAINTTVLVEGEATVTNIAPFPWDFDELIRSISALSGAGWSFIAQDSFMEVMAAGVASGATVVLPFGRLDGSPFGLAVDGAFPAFVGPGLVAATLDNRPLELVSGTGMPIDLSAVLNRVDIAVDYYYDLASEPAGVPEPGTVLLFGAGLAALVARHRRQSTN
jgi:hypothetical protein